MLRTRIRTQHSQYLEQLEKSDHYVPCQNHEFDNDDISCYTNHTNSFDSENDDNTDI